MRQIYVSLLPPHVPGCQLAPATEESLFSAADMSDARVESVKKGLDWVAFGFAGLTVAQVIHIVLGVPAAIYMCLRCYEWFEKRRKNKKGS